MRDFIRDTATRIAMLLAAIIPISVFCGVAAIVVYSWMRGLPVVSVVVGLGWLVISAPMFLLLALVAVDLMRIIRGKRPFLLALVHEVSERFEEKYGDISLSRTQLLVRGFAFVSNPFTPFLGEAYDFISEQAPDVDALGHWYHRFRYQAPSRPGRIVVRPLLSLDQEFRMVRPVGRARA